MNIENEEELESLKQEIEALIVEAESLDGYLCDLLKRLRKIADEELVHTPPAA
jgi:hypothetical protein